jgi:Protein of unknown function (DUF2934)
MSELNDAIARARAHALWEAAGQPQGRHEEFWLQAESELKDDPIAKELKLQGNIANRPETA